MKLGAAAINGENRATKKEPTKESEVVLPVWTENAERRWGCELREKQVQEGGSGQPVTKHKPEPGQPDEDYDSRWGWATSYSLTSNRQK